MIIQEIEYCNHNCPYHFNNYNDCENLWCGLLNKKVFNLGEDEVVWFTPVNDTSKRPVPIDCPLDDYMTEEQIRKDERMKMGAILCSYLHYSHTENERCALESKGVPREILKGRMFEDSMILEALEELRVTGTIKLTRIGDE